MRLHTEAFTQRFFYTQNLLRTSLRKTFPSSTLYQGDCANHFIPLPSTIFTTKVAQTTSQYYFSTNYKTCTKHFPVLLCTKGHGQSTSQYYFVLQRSQKGLPSTTLYFKARKKYFPVLLWTTKLAQRTSKHYLYYKASPMQHFAGIIHYLSAILVLCDVLLCDDCDVWLCDVFLCDVLLCDVLLCNVSWWDVLICAVMYYCYVMYCFVILLSDVLLCDVLLCDAESHIFICP